MAVDTSTIPQLIDILGADNVHSSAEAMHPYLYNHRNGKLGQAQAVVLPQTTAQVQQVVALCAAHNVPMVPQGGNTGHMAGQIADTPQAVVIALKNMQRIRSLSPHDGVLVCDSGVTLQNVRDYAAQQGWLFPLSIPSQGSAQVGGLISTNAGGTAVLRYGQMRALTLGVEAVLPNGDVLSRLSTVRKDNAGYALSQYFIGAEGTLGIITGAALKLFPMPSHTHVAMVAFNTLEDFLPLLALLEHYVGQSITTCELLSQQALQIVKTHMPQVVLPIQLNVPWWLLIEVSDYHNSLMPAFEQALAQALDKHLITDAVVAQNKRQAADMYNLREWIPEAQKHEAASFKHDVSVPRACLPQFVAQVNAQVVQQVPHIRPIIFGHIADGNLHYNFSRPKQMSNNKFIQYQHVVQEIVHTAVQQLGGSIAAEHGIGRLKAAELQQRLDPVAWHMMHTIKQAVDPQGIMNPRCVLYR